MLKHLHIVYIFILFPFFSLGSRTRRRSKQTPNRHARSSTPVVAMTASHDGTPSSPQTSSESSYDVDSDIASFSFCRVVPDDTDTMTSSSSSSCFANSSDDSRTSCNVLPSAVVRRLNAISQTQNSCRCWSENSIWASTNPGTGLVVTTLQWRRLP